MMTIIYKSMVSFYITYKIQNLCMVYCDIFTSYFHRGKKGDYEILEGLHSSSLGGFQKLFFSGRKKKGRKRKEGGEGMLSIHQL